eukprot:2478411-Amphidinium_carterae.1
MPNVTASTKKMLHRISQGGSGKEQCTEMVSSSDAMETHDLSVVLLGGVGRRFLYLPMWSELLLLGLG